MGSHGHKPWLWPYRWGDSTHPPICARGSRHLITVIYSCRILHFSITQIHRGSTAARAMAFEQTPIVFLGQVPAPSAVIMYHPRKMRHQNRALHRMCISRQSLDGESWPYKQPGRADVSPACSFSRSDPSFVPCPPIRQLAVRAEFSGSILDFLEGCHKQVAPPPVRRRRSLPSRSPVSRMILVQRSPFISTFRSVTTLLRTSPKQHGTSARNHLGSHNLRASASLGWLLAKTF